ncbi:MAG TPA: Asp-tRNA(Asn)/Glu-tRNA(Gln) amidotransferase subunit GatA [Halanaerobiales bacterium]|nr:Asp-tRNA(Asn)/Glu-tRNA(Gln) amidotransferase subunit GatA [Halanaerobiales bacterium]
MELYKRSLTDLKNMLDEKRVKLKDIHDSFSYRIGSVDSKVKAFVNTNKDLDIENLNENNYKDTYLRGLPIAIKDNISTDGINTTCSSKMLEDYKPPYDATVVKKINEAGGIITGKTNMDEYAMGSSTENSAFYPTVNPWGENRVPGGSSGGSAAAVAAGMAPVALGSDTGGSIRQPASFCGVVGLKPTYGAVSRYGLVAFASSLDQIGPLARNVDDIALMMNVIAGNDENDSTCVDREYPDFTDYLKNDVRGMKIGIPNQYFEIDFDEEVRESVMNAIEQFKKAGAEVERVDVTGAEYALAAYYIIATAEASSNLARYDGVRYGLRAENVQNLKDMFTETRQQGFGEEVKRRIMLGTYVLSAGYYDDFYLKAQKVRTLIKNDFDELFEEYDLIVSPTTPTTAFKIGEKMDPLEMYAADIFTVPVNIAGIPAISVPCGFDQKGLPIGIQLMGPHFKEEKLIQAAYSLEKILDLDIEYPALK